MNQVFAADISSQPEELVARLEAAHASHDAEVVANVRHVRVGEPTVGSAKAQIFFCNITALEVVNVVKQGDGGPLPHTPVIDGLTVEGPGYYDLENVLIRNNGAIHISPTAETRWTRVPMPMYAQPVH